MKRNSLIFGLAFLSLGAWAQEPLEKPVAKPATNITANAFTANWEPVERAEGYCVFVYTQKKQQQDSEALICHETFDGITRGSIAEPEGGDEEYADLSEKGFTDTYGWTAYLYPSYASGMVDGLVYSPYLDLAGDNGKFKVVIKTLSSDGDNIRVVSNGDSKEEQTYTVHIENGGTGFSTDTLTFNNGSKNLFLSILNVTAEPGYYDWVDEVSILQNRKKDEIINTMIASNEAIDAEDEDSGEKVTSARFTNLSFRKGETDLYYDIYAEYDDWDHPHGSMPYTAVYSPYSDLVKVDLSNRTSEVVTGIKSVSATATRNNADVTYDLAGQRVDKNYKGIVIRNGKKIAQ